MPENGKSFQNVVLLLKKKKWTKSQKKIVSVNFSRVLFTLLDFLTFEDGPDGLSQNVSTELPLYTA
jgi:hypothetical protein